MKKGVTNYENVDQVEMVLKTTKQSQTGIFSNQRLLVIKAGVVSYFSEIPKKFTGSTKAIQLAGQLPKYTILANDIDHMDLKTGSLTILFKKQKLISKAQFNDLVTQKQAIPDSSEKSSQSESNFIKWIFQCEDEEMMREFYRLINLFRTSNAKFKPSLGSYVQGFQKKKGNQAARQMSMTPNESSKMFNSTKQGRMSEIPITNNDLFLQNLAKSAKKQQPKVKIQPKEAEVQMKWSQIIHQAVQQLVIKNEPLDQVLQTNRLNQVKQKIQNKNYPELGIIDQKQNEDKMSEMSKNFNFPEKKSDGAEKIVQNIEEVLLNTDTSTLLDPNIQDPLQKKEQEKFPIEQSPKIVEILPPPPQQQKPSILQESIRQLAEQDEQNSKSLSSSQQEPTIHEQTVNQNNYSTYTFNEEQLYIQEKRLKEFLKACNYNRDNDIEEICEHLNITKQDYQYLIKHFIDQDMQYWSYIQTKLTKQIASHQQQEQLSISQDLITQFHQLYETSASNSHHKGLLEHEISFDSYQHKNQEERVALQWISAKLLQENPKPFDTKIFSKYLFKVYIRNIEFKKEKMIYMEDGWIINVGSYLQQFLGCLRLQKIVQDLSVQNAKKMVLRCADRYYLRYKQYEGIARQVLVGCNIVPLKSIKCLQFLTKRREVLLFQQEFPQFAIMIECIKENKQYRFHLDRISEDYNKSALVKQLKKITFSYHNEIDTFYSSQEYQNVVDYCLRELQKIQEQHININSFTLENILQKIDHNITLNILFKMLNCRMDHQGNLYFHHMVLKLGGRQFGQELECINRAKKKGNIDLGVFLSKRVISKLEYYQHVTPMNNFIQIYLQIIDLMIVQEGQLHRAIPILLKILSNLSQYEIEQYSIYLFLMKIYLKLNQISNFIKIMQNCRLFIYKTFKEYSLILDYPFKRLITIFLLNQDINKALVYNDSLMKVVEDDGFLPKREKEEYYGKCKWDRCNMLVTLGKVEEAYLQCQQYIKELQGQEYLNQETWNEGVICLGKCWLLLDEINSINASNLQKRLAKSLEFSFCRQNLQMTFIIYDICEKVLAKSIENKFPKILEYFPAYERARIQHNQSQAYLKDLIIHKK